MKTRNWVIGSGVALAIGGYSYYKYALNNFSFAFGSVNVTGVSGNSVSLTLKFNVSSKSGISFTVNGFGFNVYANGVLVGIATNSQPTVIPGDGSVTTLVANTTIDTSQIASNLESLLVDAVTSSIQFSINGMVSVMVNLPLLSFFNVNYPISMNFPVSVGDL